MKTLSLAFALVAAFIAASSSVSAQQSYADVLVVINSNSAASEQIGAYFAAQRSVPSARSSKRSSSRAV